MKFFQNFNPERKKGKKIACRFEMKIVLGNLEKKIHFYLPLRFRKAGRVWCGGARETH